MNRNLPDEAVAFAKVLRSAIEAAGGVDLARRSYAEPSVRESSVAPLLDELGAWDIDPREDPMSLAIAASACRVSGMYVLPYPICERLAGREPHEALAFISTQCRRAPMVDLPLSWIAIDERGVSRPAWAASQLSESSLGRFVVDVAVGEPIESATDDLPLILTLQNWSLLGTLERAVDLTCTYVEQRSQFGRALSAFQAVQFALADASIAVQGLQELALYTAWRVGRDRGGALADAVGLRSAAVEAAGTVFRIAHQLHGAMGFCDESDISWLSRASQPYRRLPFGADQTLNWMLELIETDPWQGLFYREGAQQWGVEAEGELILARQLIAPQSRPPGEVPAIRGEEA
jgi:hypothetical protein